MARQGRDSPLPETSSVAALVPHYKCEEWLGDCLESLVNQTRPLQAIIVIDDASAEPPAEIVQHFPQVTLLTSLENSGPYRLIQEVINNTRFPAYLFNDADDWSSPDRLEVLLKAARKTNAEMIGSQEIRIYCDEAEAIPWCYPVDVNAALMESPQSFPLLHPTSLVSRDLIQRIGGYATGMRFSGDAEFLRRATHAGWLVNVSEFCYFRRKRAGALTSSSETGFQSSARRETEEIIRERAVRNAAKSARNELPDLRPYKMMPPVELTHISGPRVLKNTTVGV
jgi:glycosyltransferase involved in cell wall biosynthesis